MITDPEQATLADIFRAVNDARAETKEEIAALREEMRSGFHTAAEERQAIRHVLDREMADLKSMVNVERRLSKLEAAIEKPARVKR